MGGVIRSLTGGKPEAPQRDAELDRLTSEEKAREESAKRAASERRTERKFHLSAGLIGSRSLFGRPGGRGYFEET